MIYVDADDAVRHVNADVAVGLVVAVGFVAPSLDHQTGRIATVPAGVAGRRGRFLAWRQRKNPGPPEGLIDRRRITVDGHLRRLDPFLSGAGGLAARPALQFIPGTQGQRPRLESIQFPLKVGFFHVGLLLNFCFGTTSMDSSPSIGAWWPTILMPLIGMYPPSPSRALVDHRANGISPL